MKIKKNNFTLMEVIISLFLIAIIISFLFGYFSKIMKIEKNIEEVKVKVFEKNHIHIRLNHIFSQIVFDINDPFYTEYGKNTNELVLNFCFDNGIDPETSFSSIQKAKIFIDNANNLCLEIKPKEKNADLKRKEILFKNVKTIKYKFLASKNDLLKNHIEDTISDSIYWYNFLPKKTRTYPSIISLKINNNLNFAFFLPGQNVKI